MHSTLRRVFAFTGNRPPRGGDMQIRFGSGVVFGLAALSMAWATSAGAGTLAAAKASQVIELNSSGNGCLNNSQWAAVDTVFGPDGTSTSGFTIPDNQVLVITDASFIVQGVPTGNFVSLAVVRVAPSGPTNSIYDVAVTTGPGNVGFANASFRGAVVKSGTSVCIVCRNISANAFVPLGGCAVRIHGYLAKDS